MDPTRFIVFSGALATFHLLTDLALYFLVRSYAKRKGWNAIWYKSIAYIIPAVLFFFLYTQWQKQVDGVPNALTNSLLVVLTIWHIPKYLVLVVGWTAMAGHTIVSYIKHFFLARKPNSSRSEPSPKEVNTTRRQILKTATVAAVAAPYIAVGRGIYTAFLDIDVRYIPLPIRDLPRAWEGCTIAQLSDVHAGSFFSSIPVRSFVEETLSLKPDLITITGDWVNFRPSELPMIFPEFGKLKAPLGVFGSLGNHDHYMSEEQHLELTQAIRDNNINLLVNSSALIRQSGENLFLAGIDNIGSRQHFGNIEASLAGREEGTPTVLLAHDPTVWDKYIRGQQPVDVVLSGHTHGGQFVVDVFGEEVSPARAVYKQWAGFYDDATTGQVVYVNRGLGTTGVPMRVGIPPEITLFTLMRA